MPLFTGFGTTDGSVCCCGGCGNVTVCCEDCAGAAYNGATVTITGTGGFSVTGVTATTGCVSLPIPSSGTYTISAQDYANDIAWPAVSVSLSCGGGYTFSAGCCFYFEAIGFCSNDIGCDVTIDVIDTINPTTVIFSVTVPPGLGDFLAVLGFTAGRTYKFNIQPGGGLPSFSVTQGPIACGDSLLFNCFDGVPNPGTSLAPMGYITDSLGTWPVTGAGFSVAGGGAGGACYLASPGGQPYCDANSQTPIEYYMVFCDSSSCTSFDSVSIYRLWAVQTVAPSGCAFQGPLTPGVGPVFCGFSADCPSFTFGNYWDFGCFTPDACDGSFSGGFSATNNPGSCVPPITGAISFVLA